MPALVRQSKRTNGKGRTLVDCPWLVKLSFVVSSPFCNLHSTFNVRTINPSATSSTASRQTFINEICAKETDRTSSPCHDKSIISSTEIQIMKENQCHFIYKWAWSSRMRTESGERAVQLYWRPSNLSPGASVVHDILSADYIETSRAMCN